MPTVSHARLRRTAPARALRFQSTGMVCQVLEAGICRCRKTTIPQPGVPVHFATCDIDFAVALNSRNFEAIVAGQEIE